MNRELKVKNRETFNLETFTRRSAHFLNEKSAYQWWVIDKIALLIQRNRDLALVFHFFLPFSPLLSRRQTGPDLEKVILQSRDTLDYSVSCEARAIIVIKEKVSNSHFLACERDQCLLYLFTHKTNFTVFSRSLGRVDLFSAALLRVRKLEKSIFFRTSVFSGLVVQGLCLSLWQKKHTEAKGGEAKAGRARVSVFRTKTRNAVV